MKQPWVKVGTMVEVPNPFKLLLNITNIPWFD
jgi:hypothetical protein